MQYKHKQLQSKNIKLQINKTHLQSCTLCKILKCHDIIYLTNKGIKMAKLDFSSKHADKFITIGLNVSYYRRKLSMTQEDLAYHANLSRTHISYLEAPNVVYSISLDAFFNIAEVLQVSPSDLLKEK